MDPERLRAHNITLAEVERAAGDAATVASGGFVDTPNQRLPVRHVSTIESPEDLARSIVAFRNGSPLRLGDVAEVQEGYPPPIGDAIINDVPGLLLIVEKQPTGNTLDVTRNVETVLDDMKPGLKGVQLDSTIFRPATFIEMSLDNLGRSLVIGCILVIVVLVVFLFDWRTALISTTAIPLSLVAAALVLREAGVTINTMVLAGLIIALGEVVDDAIIDVENIVRRLRLNRESTSRRIDVTCNVQQRDLGSVAREIEGRVRQVEFDRGYHPEFLGEYAAQQASRRQMILVGLVAFAGIVVLLYSEFRAWRLVILVLLSFVFAVVGGLFGVWFGGGSLSLGSLVGFVTVVGIAVRNGIMMISHYRHLELQEQVEFGTALAIRGAEERLSPILMTALTAALALLPLIVAGNRPGHEIEYPMALVIVGGLIFSTLMNLFLLPAVYRAIGRVKRLTADADVANVV